MTLEATQIRDSFEQPSHSTSARIEGMYTELAADFYASGGDLNPDNELTLRRAALADKAAELGTLSDPEEISTAVAVYAAATRRIINAPGWDRIPSDVAKVARHATHPRNFNFEPSARAALVQARVESGLAKVPVATRTLLGANKAIARLLEGMTDTEMP